MNIFATSRNPHLCAVYLDDKRVVKMMLETVQLLSTAARLTSRQINDDNGLYKVTMANHPCAIWVRDSKANYLWTWQHALFLSMEYKCRYIKNHASSFLLPKLLMYSSHMPAQDSEDITEFADCTQTNRDDLSIYKRYRICLQEKWKFDVNPPRWTNRGAPEWRDTVIG